MGKDVTTGTTSITLHLFGKIKKLQKLAFLLGLCAGALAGRSAAAGHLLGLGVGDALLLVSLGFGNGFGARLLGGDLGFACFGLGHGAVGVLLAFVVHRSDLLDAGFAIEGRDVGREVLRRLQVANAFREDITVRSGCVFALTGNSRTERARFLLRRAELGVGQFGLFACSIRSGLPGKFAGLLDADVVVAACEQGGECDDHEGHQGFQRLVHFGPPKAV